MSASSRTPPITDSVKDLLSGVGGVLAGAVTAYIGAQISRRGQEDGRDAEVARRSQEPPEEPPGPAAPPSPFP